MTDLSARYFVDADAPAASSVRYHPPIIGDGPVGMPFLVEVLGSFPTGGNVPGDNRFTRERAKRNLARGEVQFPDTLWRRELPQSLPGRGLGQDDLTASRGPRQ